MPADDPPFLPVRIAVLTVSDTRGLADDRSGDVLVERLTGAGHVLADRAILRDDSDAIVMRLRGWIADRSVDCVITTGGTGVTGRDVTPEAIERVADKMIPGFGELFRWVSYAKIGTSTVPVARLRLCRRGHLHFRAARIDRGGQGRLGRDPGEPARQPAPALQLRRADAPAERAIAAQRPCCWRCCSACWRAATFAR